MITRLLLYIKLHLQKTYYFILNILSDCPVLNRYAIPKKIYTGTSILSLSLIIATSCNTQSQKTSNIENTNDSIPGEIKDTISKCNNDTSNKNLKNSNKPKFKHEEPLVSCYDMEVIDTIAIDTVTTTCYIGIPDPENGINGMITTADTLNFVEQMPEFKGGMDSLLRYIQDNIKYPAVLADTDISGRIIVSFVVNTKGKINNPRIVRSLDPIVDKEAIRVVMSMPDWIPGKQNGVNVNVRMTIPVSFNTLQ